VRRTLPVKIDEWAIGRRIASHRVRRGLTQEELAGLMGISLSMMKKIESGDRLVTRFSQLMMFAQVLRVNDLRELTGVPLPLMPDGLRGHPSAEDLRQAMTVRGSVAGEPPDLGGLARDIERTWQTWQEASLFRYSAVGQQLPALVVGCEAAVRLHRGELRRRALQEASKLYQLVRTWTKRVGEHELSLLAADRAASLALDADDPDLAGAAAWNMAMILSAQGKTGPAREVVYRAIEDLRPYLDDAAEARLAVFGGLHLMGATEAARDDKADEVCRMLDVADRLAGRVGETNHFRMVFGRTNVALHRMSAALELGRTGEALETAERITVDQTPAVERRLTYCLDAARGYARKRNDIAAVHMLQRMHRESPEELRFSVLVRETLRQLMGRAKPAVMPDLRPLLAAANLPD
jgi:transcriptional regulator with XRE-family HTH domain